MRRLSLLFWLLGFTFSALQLVASSPIKFECEGSGFNCRLATAADVDEIAAIFIEGAEAFLDTREPEGNDARTNLRAQLVIPPKVVGAEGASLAIAKWWTTQKLGALWVATIESEKKERIINIMEMKLMDSHQLGGEFAAEVEKYNTGKLISAKELYNLNLPESVNFISYRFATNTTPSSQLFLDLGAIVGTVPTNLFSARPGWLQFIIYAGSVYSVDQPKIKNAFGPLRDYAWKNIAAAINKKKASILDDKPHTHISASLVMGQVAKNFKMGTKPSLESFERTMADVGLQIAQVQAFETSMPVLKREYHADSDDLIDGMLPLDIGSPQESGKHVDNWVYAAYFVMEAFRIPSRL